MLFEIPHKLSGEILFSTKTANIKLAVEAAIKNEVDLSEADLSKADLRWSDLSGADLREADLNKADLRWSDLSGANLRWSDLSGTNLDFSCWPFRCGSFYAKADDRLVAQLFAHWARLDVSQCSPMVRYAHKTACSLFGGFLKNLFCQFRDDVNPI